MRAEYDIGDFDEMKKVGVIGHFAIGHECLNGQTIKTKIITEELQRQLGKDQVGQIDTYGGKRTLLKAPFQAFGALKNSENVLIFPAHNGLRVYAPLLALLRHLFKRRKLHYVVIGGWLPQFLVGRKWLAKALKSFDGIYVETKTMEAALEQHGFTNVYVLPNCKNLSVLAEENLIYSDSAPYKLCTFSRVAREKGIEDAVKAVEAVNTQLGQQAFSLDIYGQIDAGQTEWFENLQKTFPAYICYKGKVPYDKSVDILKGYFALLFPTRCFTEGIPGTIIDAYAAGIPVVSAKWESYADIVDDGITGIGFNFENIKQLAIILFDMVKNPQLFLDMKINCIQKANKYLPNHAVKILVDRFW